jgi:hypothetical protein
MIFYDCDVSVKDLCSYTIDKLVEQDPTLVLGLFREVISNQICMLMYMEQGASIH